MKTISLFKEETDRKTFEELRKRLDRYGKFKFFKFFLGTWALVYISIQILVIGADRLWHFSTQLLPQMTMSDAIELGITVAFWTAGITGLLALVYSLVVKLKRKERDLGDLRHFENAYKSGQIDAFYKLLTERSAQVNGFRVVAEGLDNTEISLIQKAARGSAVFASFENEFREAWNVFVRTTEILVVQPAGQPTAS